MAEISKEERDALHTPEVIEATEEALAAMEQGRTMSKEELEKIMQVKPWEPTEEEVDKVYLAVSVGASPVDLSRAHDRALGRLYNRKLFKYLHERIEHILWKSNVEGNPWEELEEVME